METLLLQETMVVFFNDRHVSGVFYLFIVLPFVFMEFLYKPFMEYQTGARVPRKFERSDEKHLILTHYDTISHDLMDKLTQFGYPLF